MNHEMRYEAAPRIPGRISGRPAPKNAPGMHSGHSSAAFPVQSALFGREECDPDPFISISLSHSLLCDAEMPEGIPPKRMLKRSVNHSIAFR